MKILIVEDDPIISQSLHEALEEKGYESRMVTNFSRVMDEFKSFDPHLVLLDVKLPYFNGYYWCTQIRKESQVPIIFISSVTESMNQLMAIELGGDDFISKPFDLAVTLAKIEAWLRRAYPDQSLMDASLSFAGVQVHPERSQIEYKDQTLTLTFTELQIMTLLFRKQGAFASRNELLDYCWQNNQFIDDNTLAVNISRLRSKLKTIGLDDFIETKKKVGYRLKEAGSSDS